MPQFPRNDHPGVALLFRGPGQPLAIVELPLPRPEAGELAVSVASCALCGSDVHSLLGRREVPTPTVLGHEVAGTVIAVGSPAPDTVDGVEVALGDRVVFAPCASCGQCTRCQRGLPQKCERLQKFGHRRQSLDSPASGGFADTVLVPRGTPIVKVPSHLSDAAAAVCACAVATAAAALRTAGPVAGAHVLVHGAGLLGLSVAAFAQRMGAREVTVVDPDPRRVPWIERLRARAISGDAASRDVASDDHLAGEFDVAIECSGAAAAIEAQHRMLAVGGIQVLVGSVLPTPPFRTSPERIVRGMLQIRGLHNYAGADLLAAVRLMAQPAFPLAADLGPTLGLREFDEALRLAREGNHLRIFLDPSA